MVTTTMQSGVRVVLSGESIQGWPANLLGAGYRVIAPCAIGQNIEYCELSKDRPVATGFNKGLPRMSIKGAWFPRSEPILKLRRLNKEWTVEDPPLQFPKTIIFGARPCDAAAPHILAPLFGWDFHDPFFEQRINSLVFIVAACHQPMDNACFCTSVGVDPAGEKAGDVLLTQLPDGSVLAESNTERGAQLLEALAGEGKAPDGTLDMNALREQMRQSIPLRFNKDQVRAGLEKRFDDPMWERTSRSCQSCGTCAFVCPTCHCFDIQEESAGTTGMRQKNWDACALPLFTLHTSGHNPRSTQAARWRQRLNHKFRYYPEKFGHTLCTGCGRCIRLCPAGMDLLADLKEMGKGDPGRVGTAHQAPATDGPANGGQCPPYKATPGILASNPASSLNIYRPYMMRIADLRDETPDVRTLKLEFADPTEAERFDFRVGQFGLYGALGEGESTFCIASASTRKGYIECTFRQAGRVTRALRRLNVGDLMGFRGPYGNSFPVESWRGKDLLFIAGGIALPPMRSVIQYCLDNRKDYGDITIVYGARTSQDHVYKHELAEWEDRPDVRLWLCIDWKPAPDGKGLAEAEAEKDWWPINMKDPGATELYPRHRRYTAFVPQLVEAVKPPPENRVAVLCGPPIMIKFTLASLKKLGYDPANVFTTLENRMKCGLGKCGRCNVGSVYVCKEGPVFTAAQVEAMPASEM